MILFYYLINNFMLTANALRLDHSYKKFIDEKNKINKFIIMYIDLDMIICGCIDDLILNH
jgi:hypothetical protein